jgi:uncharacterized protein (TIGR00369 family)
VIAYLHGAVPGPTPPHPEAPVSEADPTPTTGPSTGPTTADADGARTRTVRWQDPMATARAGQGVDGLAFLRAMMAGELPPPPIAMLMGFRLVDAEPGRATFAMDVGEHLYNPIGSVHGGVYGTLLDSAMGCAVQTRVAAGGAYTTLDYAVQLVRGIRPDVGTVWCHGEVVHLGRRVATASGRVVDADGRLYATGTTTCLLLGG